MYFFDTYALVELFLGNPGYRRYIGFPLTVCALNIGEFYIYLARTYGKATAGKELASSSFDVLELTKGAMVAAAEFKLEHAKKRLSWADCAGYVLARHLNLKFLTGDSQFKGMSGVEFITSQI